MQACVCGGYPKRSQIRRQYRRRFPANGRVKGRVYVTFLKAHSHESLSHEAELLRATYGGAWGGEHRIELSRDFPNVIAEANPGASKTVRGDSAFRRHLPCFAAPQLLRIVRSSRPISEAKPRRVRQRARPFMLCCVVADMIVGMMSPRNLTKIPQHWRTRR